MKCNCGGSHNGSTLGNHAGFEDEEHTEEDENATCENNATHVLELDKQTPLVLVCQDCIDYLVDGDWIVVGEILPDRRTLVTA